MSSLVQVDGLGKTYYQGLLRRRVDAVRGISFRVEAGQIFGFLGPNGAGKTTTIKVLTGLITPSYGSARLFDVAVSDPRARRGLGFLPENPYVYPYLTPREFVAMSARLSGLPSRVARAQTEWALKTVGIEYAAERAVRRLSKGMLQRVGLAAALVADPQLLILDEPMSGLDPVGRKEVRDLLLEQRRRGRTILFSTHILSDVETLCDHVLIMRRGKIVVSGPLQGLLKSGEERIDIVVIDPALGFEGDFSAKGFACHRIRERLQIEVQGSETTQRVLAELVARGAEIVSVAPRSETLEALFVREAIEQRVGSGAPPSSP